jgi:hypothetical protein
VIVGEHCLLGLGVIGFGVTGVRVGVVLIVRVLIQSWSQWPLPVSEVKREGLNVLLGRSAAHSSTGDATEGA